MKRRGPRYADDFVSIPPQGLIGNAAIQTRLVRSLNLRERAPAPTLSPEIQAVIIVDDLSKVPSQGAVTQKDCMGGTAVTAGGINPGSISLLNPIGSGIVARVHKILLAANTGNDVKIAIENFVSGTSPAGAEALADLTIGGIIGVPSCEIRSSTDVGGAAPLESPIRLRSPTASVEYNFPPIVLSPVSPSGQPQNAAINVYTPTVSAQMFVTFYWTEIDLIP